MRFVNVVSAAIYGSKRWKFLAVIVVIAIVKTGIWVIPTIPGYARMASDPFHYHPNLTYLPENWLHTFIGWLVFARDWRSFAVLNLVLAFAFLAVMFTLFFRRLSDRSARTATLIFIAMPVSTTAFYWLGLDSLTVLLMALALLVMRRWWLVVIVGFLLGMQHFEQGIASALLLAGASGVGIIMRQRSWRSLVFPVVFGVGLVAGRGLLNLLYSLWHITIDYDRIDYFRDNFLALVHQYFDYPFLIWFSILGITWLAVVRFALQGRKAIPMLVGIVVLALATIIYSDHTRVACILSLMLLVSEMLLDEEFLSSITSGEIVFFAVLWLIVPFVWVWGVVVQPSSISFDVQAVLHKLFGWFGVPRGDNFFSWPFIIP